MLSSVFPSHALTSHKREVHHRPQWQELDLQRAFHSFAVDRVQWTGHERNYNGTVNRLPTSRTTIIQSHEHIVLTRSVVPVIVTISEASPTRRTWLQDALRQLEESHECAADEKLSPPSTIAIQKTDKLLREMSECVEAAPDIYPMHESSLAIDFRTPDGRSGVLFVIEQKGSGTLFFPTRDSDGWSSVEDAADLFEKRGADELKRAGIR